MDTREGKEAVAAGGDGEGFKMVDGGGEAARYFKAGRAIGVCENREHTPPAMHTPPPTRLARMQLRGEGMQKARHAR